MRIVRDTYEAWKSLYGIITVPQLPPAENKDFTSRLRDLKKISDEKKISLSKTLNDFDERLRKKLIILRIKKQLKKLKNKV